MLMKSLKLLSLVAFCGLPMPRARAAENGEALIQKMAGCFAVSYRFVEDGTHDVDIHGSFEEIENTRAADGALIFQHAGILNNKKFRHLKEEWRALPGDFWEQKVFGPSGAFRYECHGRFENGQLRCLAPASPKPVRDRERKDYATLDRENTIQITDKGWVQSERNIKRDAQGLEVSREVGWVEYRKSEKANCAATE